MMPRETIAFPMVALVEGGVTTDGEQVLLQLMTVEDGPINFRLRLSDMESFVTFLLQMAASAKQPSPTEDRVRYQPIPISGISDRGARRRHGLSRRHHRGNRADVPGSDRGHFRGGAHAAAGRRRRAAAELRRDL
jgi:hypothetical protein